MRLNQAFEPANIGFRARAEPSDQDRTRDPSRRRPHRVGRLDLTLRSVVVLLSPKAEEIEHISVVLHTFAELPWAVAEAAT
jgi:hypothetical protein